MDADAFKLVTTAIQGRIAAAAGTDVHVGPLDDTDATGSGLVLFLYRVAVNPDLRNTGHRPPPKQREPAAPAGGGPPPPPSTQSDIAEVFEGALPFDLFYLLSASPSKGG